MNELEQVVSKPDAFLPTHSSNFRDEAGDFIFGTPSRDEFDTLSGQVLRLQRSLNLTEREVQRLKTAEDERLRTTRLIRKFANLTAGVGLGIGSIMLWRAWGLPIADGVSHWMITGVLLWAAVWLTA